MNKQEAIIKYNENEFFFFRFDFKSAIEHAEEFIHKNKVNFDMKLYLLNESPFGEKWRFYKKISKTI